MNKMSPDFVLPGWLRRWEQFWFTPADPTMLGLIRITCGMIAIYTLMAYTFHLQDFMGKDAWHDLELRNLTRHDRPMTAGALSWTAAGELPAPVNDWQKEYREKYRHRWKIDPPPPYPLAQDQEMVTYLDDFIKEYLVDVRVNGAGLPKNDFQRKYADRYIRRWHAPPPAFVDNAEEEAAINDYMEHLGGTDPRLVYAKGTPVFSLWFDILDPTDMMIVHVMIVAVAVLFTIGFCTRFTTALTWFGSLCYIHRNPSTLFGVDTMMTIVLLYLMIGPSGAAFSVDNLIRRWWRKAKPGVVQAWYGFWKRPIPAAADIAPAADSAAPSVSANVAIRLLQIHLCIIYLFAGTSKLQGQTWWNGDALWLTIGNYEFAPMQFELYLKTLRFLGGHLWLFKAFLTIGGYFTLCFEIGYTFGIWRPSLRWVFLSGALVLHGLIGLLMGLKTFSLMMLVMNMAFLRKEEVMWVFHWFSPAPANASTTTTAPLTPELAKQPVGVAATGIVKK